MSLCESSPYTSLSCGVLPHKSSNYSYCTTHGWYPCSLLQSRAARTSLCVSVPYATFLCKCKVVGLRSIRKERTLSSTLLISHYTCDINWRFPYGTAHYLLGCSHYVCPFCRKVSISCIWTEPENNKASVCAPTRLEPCPISTFLLPSLQAGKQWALPTS